MLGPYFHRNTATSNCRTPCLPGNPEGSGPVCHHPQAPPLGLRPSTLAKAPETAASCYGRWGDQTPLKPTCFLHLFNVSSNFNFKWNQSCHFSKVAHHKWKQTNSSTFCREEGMGILGSSSDFCRSLAVSLDEWPDLTKFPLPPPWRSGQHRAEAKLSTTRHHPGLITVSCCLPWMW